MKRLLITSLLAMIICCANAADNMPKQSALIIKTVDKQNRAFKVGIVRWQYSKMKNRIFELTCQSTLCSSWEIKDNISGTIIINAYLSKETENDKHCWDIYAGKALVTLPAKSVTIVVKFENTVCS